MLFATQQWQTQAIISRSNTILMNFNPFMAIMRNVYHIRDESSAGDLDHITEEKKKKESKK